MCNFTIESQAKIISLAQESILIIITHYKNNKFMATIKLKFRASSVAEKEGTLYYQVIYKRNVKWISTDYHVFQNEWDEKAANITIPPDGKRM